MPLRLALLAAAVVTSAPAWAVTVHDIADEHGLLWVEGLGFRHVDECEVLPMWQSRTTEWPRVSCESVPLVGSKAAKFAAALLPEEAYAMPEEAPVYASLPSNQHTRTPLTWTPPPLPPLFAPTPRTPHIPATPPPPVVPLPASFWMLLTALFTAPLWRKPT